MAVFVAGVGLFAIAFMFHVAAWNFRVPRRQAVTLLLIFLTAGAVGALGLWIFNGSWGFTLTPLRLVLAVLLYFSNCAFYFLLFSAIEVDSPTMTLIGLIRRGGSQGISHEQLAQKIASRSFVRPRLEQMIHDGMLVQIQDRLYPGARGRMLAALVLYYRKMLGQRHAGG